MNEWVALGSRFRKEAKNIIRKEREREEKLRMLALL